MNPRPCRRCCILNLACILCNPHAGFDQAGIWRPCIQDVHFCW